MVAILMTPAKLFTLGLLSSKVFQNKVHDVIISVKTSPTKFYHVIQFVLNALKFYNSVAKGLKLKVRRF